MANHKRVTNLLDAPRMHWVGDGFPVRTIFSAHGHDPSMISPFLLLDHAGPAEFPPSDSVHARGVEEHPHRGFETVTIVYQGELEHRDSSGHNGRIGPGDVQWMTAASGVVHEEKHAADFTRRGGTLEMVQLWVNLPAHEKMSPPRYQELLSETMHVMSLPGGAGTLRVIAGEFRGRRGPARTVTPINLWDLRLGAGGEASLRLPPSTNTLLLVLSGRVLNNESDEIGRSQCAALSRDGDCLAIRAVEPSTLLLLNGEPIDEPVVAHGPFVMNTPGEIDQAIDDYRAGRMGRLQPLESVRSTRR